MRRRWAVIGTLAVFLAACSSSAHTATAPATTTTTTPVRAPRAASTVVPKSLWPRPGAFVGPEYTVPVGTMTVGYRQFGAGPDLVLLEGEEMTMTEWPISLLRDLAAHYRVTMFDWRGIDRSTDVASTPYSIAQLADDTVSFFDAIGLSAPNVYGLSTGGEVGLDLAIRHPDHVRRLVVSGATPGGTATVPTPPASNRVFEDPNADPLALIGLLFPPGDTRDRDAYFKELLQIPQTIASARTSQRQNAAEDAFAAGPGLAAALRRLHTPVLVLNGAQDQLVPVENARRIAAMIPGAQLHVFDDAGHFLIFNDRAQFVALLRQFTR